MGWDRDGQERKQDKYLSVVFSNHPIVDTSDFPPWIQREKWRTEGLQGGLMASVLGWEADEERVMVG